MYLIGQTENMVIYCKYYSFLLVINYDKNMENCQSILRHGSGKEAT